jgi:C1A family cysteine protease
MNWVELVGGYAIEKEDREFLSSTASQMVFASDGEMPERVDPRRSKLASEGFLKVEDQLQIGACQGNALTENGEYCHAVSNGEVIQLSRMYAYIRSQKFDGIAGDRGSTLSGGTKVAKEGICLESDAPYPRSYPGSSFITNEMTSKAVYKLRSHVDLKTCDDIKRFIGSGAGIVQIGTAWGSSFQPDSHGCIRRFAAAGGGHSVTLCGYLPDSDVGQQSGRGYWVLLKNSWGTRWGVGGYAYFSPSAVDAMLQHNWTVAIGRSDMESPRPRKIPIDFTKQSLFS